MAGCGECYLSEGRKYKKVLVAHGPRIRYEGDSTWYQPLEWETVDAGPCPKCKGTGIEPLEPGCWFDGEAWRNPPKQDTL